MPGYAGAGQAKLLRQNQQIALLQQANTIGASIAVQLERQRNAPPIGISLQIYFTDANGNPANPGAFEIDVQTSDIDQDAQYCTAETITTGLNASYVARIEVGPTYATFVRVLLKTLTNAVYATVTITTYAATGGSGSGSASGGGGSATPSGPAGGDLTGTYPNPTVQGIQGATLPVDILTPGAASTPAVSVTGAPFTGGTGTTTTPLVNLGGGAPATTWNTNGTILGINDPAGFTGNAIDVRANGAATSYFAINPSSSILCGISGTTFQSAAGGAILNAGPFRGASTSQYGFGSGAATTSTDTNISRLSAGVLQVGTTASNSLGTLRAGQFQGGSAAPAIAAGPGAGGAPTVSVIGSNAAGQVSITPDATAAASAVVATLTFSGAFSNGTAPYVVLFPANAAAAALTGGQAVYVSATATTWAINAGGTALGAVQYLWNYQVVG